MWLCRVAGEGVFSLTWEWRARRGALGRTDIKVGKAKQSQLMERSDSRILDCIMLDVVDPHYSWMMCLQICFLDKIYL